MRHAALNCNGYLVDLVRGCVTPTVLYNWFDKADRDFDLIDGLDDLPEDAQQKVKHALEQAHVDDDEWNGVSTCGTIAVSLCCLLIDTGRISNVTDTTQPTRPRACS